MEQLLSYENSEPKQDVDQTRRSLAMALVLLSLTGASVLACLTKKEKESGENMFFTEPHSIEEINNGKVLILVSADWCASCPA